MATKISAKILADSTSPQGARITTFLLTYPRIIHSELMTHRVFSRNSASSRAIPFNKMVKMVEENPFIPIAWQKDHKGMQGSEYLTDELSNQFATSNWLSARDNAIKIAKSMNGSDNGYDGVTKQLCNRLLEPFMWHTALLTGTEFENFFKLRCPLYQTPVSRTVEPQYSWKDLDGVHSNPLNLEILENNRDNYTFKFQHSKSNGEIHMQALAEAMWDAMNESIPKELEAGDWHIPKFHEKIELIDHSTIPHNLTIDEFLVKIATARAARLSYITFDGKIDYEKDIQLHDRLLADNHMSPFEHCAKAMSNEEFDLFIKGKLNFRDEESYDLEEPLFKDKGWCNNFRGWINYRYMIENNYY